VQPRQISLFPPPLRAFRRDIRADGEAANRIIEFFIAQSDGSEAERSRTARYAGCG
jgi:hypothetical protein